MANILITGGSGLIGKALIPKLLEQNHTISLLSRSEKKIEGARTFLWDISSKKIDIEAFKDVEYIIHLAGAGVAEKRWTEKRKKEIIDSRVDSTDLLLEKVQELKIDLKRFISASAIGYYGAITTDIAFTEKDQPANDFLGTVCRLWEDSILKFKKAGIPTTILRTGIVLSNEGGALSKMKTPIITPIASGKQYMPWIHLDDMCELYVQSIDGKLDGVFNAVAPEYQTNTSFSKLLAKSLNRIFIPIGVPNVVLKIVFGELSVILTTGSKISVQKLISNGYQFKFEKLTKALESLSKN